MEREIIYLEGNDGIEKLARMAYNKSLIPFFGAGFSICATAANGVVPDGQQAREMMAKIIKESGGSVSSGDDFFDVSTKFFRKAPEPQRKKFFEDNFTKVRLSRELGDFLSLDWPYAYTINVDDGIENSSDFKEVLPYHNLTKPKHGRKLLYKLHGDANHEYLQNDAGENIVFSTAQYLSAINSNENADFRNNILSDYSNSNILFIGCSLQNEMDLKTYFAESQKFTDLRSDIMRVQLRNSKADEDTADRLLDHGITHILLVDRFSEFYPAFIRAYKEYEASVKKTVYQYFNPSVNYVSDLSKDLNEEKKCSLELIKKGTIFNKSNNSFTKSGLHVSREMASKIIDSLDEYTLITVQGRRFSGKTNLFLTICERVSTRDRYFFPSDFTPDVEIVKSIIINRTNGLLLFDSNSVSPELYNYLSESEEVLRRNNHRLVLAINSSDNHMPTKLKTLSFLLPSTFENYALNQQKLAADRYGIPRRYKKESNADYLFDLAKRKTISVDDLRVNASDFSLNFTALLLLLAVEDKVYISDSIAMGITNRELSAFITRMKNTSFQVVEIVPCEREEANMHCSQKVVHNSKLALLDALDTISDDQITGTIKQIISRLINDRNRKRLRINIIMFDTLNQLFGSRPNRAKIMGRIYEELTEVLSNDLHYWLQRAKYLYRNNTSKEALDTAYSYATKVHKDGWPEISHKAALTLSLICFDLSDSVDTTNSYMLEGVEKAYEAVFSGNYRINVDDEFGKGMENSGRRKIVRNCENILAMPTVDTDYKKKATELISYFEKEKQSSYV